MHASRAGNIFEKIIKNKRSEKMQKLMKYWDIKSHQKQIKDCAADEMIINLGYLNNETQVNIGDTTYIRVPDNKIVEKISATAGSITKFMHPDLLIVSLSDFNKHDYIEMDELVINAIINQQKTIKEYEKKMQNIQDVADMMETVIELHIDKSFSDQETAKGLKRECYNLFEILN